MSSDEEYRFNPERKYQGLALLIVNFTRGKNKREGSEHDVKYLKKTFKRLGFNVALYKNVSSRKLTHILYEYSKEDRQRGYDSFAFAISTHGMEFELADKRDKDMLKHHQRLEMFDNSYVDIKEILDYFSPMRCKALRGKPKLFFIQACRIPMTKSSDKHAALGIGYDLGSRVYEPRAVRIKQQDTVDSLHDGGEREKRDAEPEKRDGEPAKRDGEPEKRDGGERDTHDGGQADGTIMWNIDYHESTESSVEDDFVSDTDVDEDIDVGEDIDVDEDSDIDDDNDVDEDNDVNEDNDAYEDSDVKDDKVSPALGTTEVPGDSNFPFDLPDLAKRDRFQASKERVGSRDVVDARGKQLTPVLASVHITAVPCYNDMLIMFASPQGHYAIRNMDIGSYMLRFLYDSVKTEYGEGRIVNTRTNFLYVLNDVADKMSSGAYYNEGYKNVTCVVHRLSKDIILSKGEKMQDSKFSLFLQKIKEVVMGN